MPRKQKQLQWHKASGQWCKRYTDPETKKKPLKYLGKGTPGSGNTGLLDELYDAALVKWQEIAEQLNSVKADHRRQERVEYLELMKRTAGSQEVRSHYRRELAEIDQGMPLEEAGVRASARAATRQAVHQGDWDAAADAASMLKEPESERTLGVKSKEFVAHALLQARSAQRSIGRYVNLELDLRQFVEWAGEHTSIDSIDSSMVRRYYTHLLKRLDDSSDPLDSTWTARDKFASMKQFIRWLGENEFIPSLPGNLSSKQLTIEVDDPNPRYLSSEQVKKLINGSTSVNRLYWLLMLNCGMTQIDISELSAENVDWAKGTLTYKRAKLRRRRTRRPQTYKLWPETLELLRQHAQPGGDRLLTTRSGTPLVRRTIKADGTAKNDNAISNAWNRERKRAGLEEFTATDLRNTTATMLRNSVHVGKESIFLQHRNNSTDAFYAADYDDTLDEALSYVMCGLGLDGLQVSHETN